LAQALADKKVLQAQIDTLTADAQTKAATIQTLTGERDGLAVLRQKIDSLPDAAEIAEMVADQSEQRNRLLVLAHIVDANYTGRDANGKALPLDAVQREVLALHSPDLKTKLDAKDAAGKPVLDVNYVQGRVDALRSVYSEVLEGPRVAGVRPMGSGSGRTDGEDDVTKLRAARLTRYRPEPVAAGGGK
jgi:hypothetical protein